MMLQALKENSELHRDFPRNPDENPQKNYIPANFHSNLQEYPHVIHPFLVLQHIAYQKYHTMLTLEFLQESIRNVHRLCPSWISQYRFILA